MTASVNVEVTKGPSENNISVLRRFTRRVQGSGILPRLRGRRYSQRTKSENVQKAKTLTKIRRKEEILNLVKEGKMPELPRYGRRR